MNERTQSPEVTREVPSKWAKAPTVRELKQDFQDAQIIHDGQVNKIGAWLDNLNVTGKAKIKTSKNNSSIQPKLIRKQAEWRYGSLTDPFLSTEELYNVSPVTWEDRKAAQQNQLVLNNQFNTKINKTNFIDSYVRTAVDEGTVIVKTGWEFKEEQYSGEVPIVEFVRNDELAPLHEHLAQLKAESPSEWMNVEQELKDAHDLTVENGFPIEPQITGYEQKMLTRVVCNKPTVEICDYRNVTIDPTCEGDLDKAQFIVYSYETSRAALQKEGKRYHNLDQINVEGNSPLGMPDHAASDGTAANFNFTDKARKKFVVHEYWGYWDVEGDGVLQPIVASWVGDTMIRMEANPFPDKKLPFVVVSYLPVRKSTHGEPDGALLEDNQKVIGAVTRGMIDILGKSANGQTGMRKDMLDATNRRRYDNGLDYEFNINVDPRLGVFMHTFPEIPNSAQFMLQQQTMEAESMTGVKSFSQGVSGQSLGDVAAGVRGALDAASKRELGILRRLSDGIVRIGRKFISMNAEFLSEEEVVRITNEEFVKVRRDDLAGNFDLKLSISTAEEDSNKAESLAFLLQTVGPNSDPELVKMILSDIAKLKKMPDLAKRIEAYKPEPDPMVQKMQELEMAELDAKIAKLRAETQKVLADAGLAVAKTENTKADTDNMNLEFVEQESGVHHARAKDLVGEQARSQAETEKVKRDSIRMKGEIDMAKAVLSLKAAREKAKVKETA
jgi:hypothetical protein